MWGKMSNRCFQGYMQKGCKSLTGSGREHHLNLNTFFFFWKGLPAARLITPKPGPYSPVASVVLVSHTFIPSAILPDDILC